jgi:hypothetical protein
MEYSFALNAKVTDKANTRYPVVGAIRDGPKSEYGDRHDWLAIYWLTITLQLLSRDQYLDSRKTRPAMHRDTLHFFTRRQLRL